ncbi:MAG TPA: hypothetical protein VHX38_12540 [Pseudonocardiaceae bacterium]|jgi:hypothetical protein|nr:hypothetical protein [Pseudonocardiaceae bacterium]
MRRTVSRVVIVGAALTAVLSLAGCADTQPGDVNNGPGYTDSVSDLLVKIPALQGDPCRSTQASQIYQNCGRYVTEVANVVDAVRAELPSQPNLTTNLQNAVNTYQQLRCESVNGNGTANQQKTCPQALKTIGAELDGVDKTLDKLPAGS